MRNIIKRKSHSTLPHLLQIINMHIVIAGMSSDPLFLPALFAAAPCRMQHRGVTADSSPMP